MSTQFYTEDRQDTGQQDTGQQDTRQHGSGPSWFRIWSVVIGTAAPASSGGRGVSARAGSRGVQREGRRRHPWQDRPPALNGWRPASASAQPPLTASAWLVCQAVVLKDRLFVGRN